MTKIHIVNFGSYSLPEFPECPMANFEKHEMAFVNNWADGSEVVLCKMHGINHTCEWRHKTSTPKEERCPYGVVF